MQEAIRKVQDIQLDMMKQLHRVCQDNGLRYVLLAGTLLGAVRHRGFIPWDDDLDIAMPREDYDRLVTLLTEQPIAGCFLQTFATDPHYVHPYAKLRKDGTKFTERLFGDVDMHSGIFVDIFPFDKVPSPRDPGARLRMLLARAMTFAIWRKEGCRAPRKGWKKIEHVTSFLLALVPRKTLAGWQRDLVCREDRDWAYAASMLDSNYPIAKTACLREELEDVVLMDFEDAQFYVPRSWDAMLRRVYGNYWELPPEDRRRSGHDVLEYAWEI